jgi:hypothetical protein
MPLTIFADQQHAAGNAPDTTPRQIDLTPPALRLDLAVYDNPALVAFSADGIYFGTEREFPAGVLSSLDLLVQSIRIRNKTVASIARYDLTGFSHPVEIVGTPYNQITRTP